MAIFAKKNLVIIVFIVSILASFNFGFLTGKSRCEICPPQGVDFSLFWEAYYNLKDSFVDKGKFDDQKIVYGAIAGMVESLEDPYTIFFSPEDAKRFEEDVKGVFEGVGMEIGIRKGQLQVIAPLEGTPAQKAGMRSGDKIIKIDDTMTADLTIEDAVSLIRGKRGTEVVLTVMRKEWEETKEIKIVRDVIKVPSLKLEIKDNDIAYLRLYQFSEKAGLDFDKTAFEILKGPAKAIILDLRDNPGGYLEVSQDIAGWFLEKGKIVTIEDFGDSRESKKYNAQGNEKLSEYPIVILMNKGSASASEILAGALRDNRDVKIIGETSFGKGSVQELKPMRGGSTLKITVARWLTPNGILISDVGLDPDIKVDMTNSDYEEGLDPQLDKAIEIIKEIR